MLGSFLHVPWMLAGLAVLAVPVIIHLLNRRRHDVVDWGAMQFLQVSDLTRRRMFLDDLLLLLVRMALLAVLVLSLAGPFLDLHWPRGLGSRTPRDVVLVIDGSASMAGTAEEDGPPPASKARDWALAFLDELGPDDGVAVLLARDQITPVVANLSRDRGRLRQRLQSLPEPAGAASWPEAVKQAFAVLAKSQKHLREVVLLGDNQKFGWADADTLFRWELLAGELGLNRPDDPASPRPRLWAVNLAPDREGTPPSYGLSPLASNRPVVPVDREVNFDTGLVLVGQKQYLPPHRLRLEIDGKPVRDLPRPGEKGTSVALPRDGKIAFSFKHRFNQPGSHLVSLVVEPDPPPEERPAGHAVRDRFPGDNRQDLSIEVVPAIPVLVVDGEGSSSAGGRLGSDFLRDALAPARDRQPAVRLRVVPLDAFTPDQLSGPSAPRVLILHNVPQLAPAPAEAVSNFAAGGGGVLVTLGERADAGWYNDQLYRNGAGWLPARLEGIRGDEGRPADAVRPDPTTFGHPMLRVFQDLKTEGLAGARFPRWWQLSTPGQNAPGTPVGILQGGRTRAPFFVERAFQAGRVLLSSVPLDNSWGTNLVDLPAFVPLVHEAVYYLAGARSADFNLRSGQPLQYRLPSGERPEDYRLTPPGGATRPLSATAGQPGTYPVQVTRQEAGTLLTYADTRGPGVYQLETPQGQTVWYVVQANSREGDLTACTAPEQERVASLVGVKYAEDSDAVLGSQEGATRRQEFAWPLLLAFVALLCAEVWMTRRLVLNR